MRNAYKGYIFTDMTTRTDDARYKARVAIMALDGSRTRSQRFLDLETFRTEAEASARALAGAMEWIDAQAGPDRLALPTNFSAL
ncbi:MAG: hypothetical protein ACRET4_12385 [Steroidobacteraceae bacterium]|jgi:hypothetical protein